MASVQMYTTRWCGYCVRAKTLLESRGIEFEEISLDDDPAFRRRLMELTGGWTVPQVLIDGKPIGGYTELWQLDRSPHSESGASAPLYKRPPIVPDASCDRRSRQVRNLYAY